jgi:hypothetical protein
MVGGQCGALPLATKTDPHTTRRRLKLKLGTVDNNGDKRPRMSVKQGRRASAFGTKNAPRIFISNGRQDRDVGAAAGGMGVIGAIVSLWALPIH